MAIIEIVQSTSTSVVFRVAQLDYNYSYNTLYNSLYPRYGTITLFFESLQTPVTVISAGSGGASGFTSTMSVSGLPINSTFTLSAFIIYYNSNYPSDPTSLGISTPSLVFRTDSRPSAYNWIFPKISGGSAILTAFEWNSLFNNINLVRAYKGLANSNYTSVLTGDPINAFHYNQAVFAIRAIPGYSSALSLVNVGDIIYAYLLNNLVTVLNSIT